MSPQEQTLTLAQFLAARMYGDVRDRERRAFAQSVPIEHHEAALVAWDRTLRAEAWGLAILLNALLFTILLTPPFSWWNGRILRQRAALYASHPDYREEWRP